MNLGEINDNWFLGIGQWILFGAWISYFGFSRFIWWTVAILIILYLIPFDNRFDDKGRIAEPACFSDCSHK